MMKNHRFDKMYTQGKLKVTKVLCENEAGVLYISYQEGYGIGLTVILDSDEKRLVDEYYKNWGRFSFNYLNYSYFHYVWKWRNAKNIFVTQSFN